MAASSSSRALLGLGRAAATPVKQLSRSAARIKPGPLVFAHDGACISNLEYSYSSRPFLRVQRRTFSYQAPSAATYRRFGQPPSSGQSGRGGKNGWAQIVEQMRAQQQGGRGGGGGRGGPGPLNARGFNGQARTILLVVVGGACTYYFVHLERVPDTGRLRFMDVSVQQEKQLGQQAFEETVRQYRDRLLPDSDPRVQLARRVANRIVSAARASHEDGNLDARHLPWAGGDPTREGNSQSGSSQSHDDLQWQVFVINSKEKNAFVLPNGKIFVFTGILPICKDEDGLATVLGHEVAHQIARHMAEKVSGYKVLMALAAGLQLFIGDANLSYYISQLVYTLPNSRGVEIEADRIGLRLMSAACYDPTKAPSLWERMEKMEGRSHNAVSDAVESIMSTHPLSSKRMTKLQEWLPEAVQIRNDTNCPSQGDVAGFRSAAGDGGRAAFPQFSRRQELPVFR